MYDSSRSILILYTDMSTHLLLELLALAVADADLGGVEVAALHLDHLATQNEKARVSF